MITPILRRVVLSAVLASILFSATSCVRTTTVEDIPPGGIPIEHKRINSR